MIDEPMKQSLWLELGAAVVWTVLWGVHLGVAGVDAPVDQVRVRLEYFALFGCALFPVAWIAARSHQAWLELSSYRERHLPYTHLWTSRMESCGLAWAIIVLSYTCGVMLVAQCLLSFLRRF